ncbi:DNA polymerase subunit beta [Streptomyces abyssalis]|uniref:DNA polymerase subunit beta n=1 Tax=Streptomyces abyssalis TaxID=933944 RepID=A0A1E7JU46_9ACTN|nr:nucleotidyltransferase domain-containing protein [Streptomyces abyssalis]OEU88872.1 DNA polymerase subunit beta [Streptomyces abyssalis]OEU93471.1 DNA polymerase subunit beta [Streptomyces abyssalis]
MDDQAFPDHVADALAALPAVEAVALGGSRAQGTQRPGSDWDFALYYRGAFDPGDLRALGWPGEVSGIGEWGGGVFNGGAWLTVDGRRTDVHYRDLDVVEHEIAEAEQGRFHREQLMFHLAGIPSYLVVGELALNEVLRGELPRPAYPSALRTSASAWWRETAGATLSYARANHVPRGGRTEVAGTIAVAAMQHAHAVLAARGDWVTNEKTLLDRAGLRGVDGVLAAAGTQPEALAAAVDAAEALFGSVLPA